MKKYLSSFLLIWTFLFLLQMWSTGLFDEIGYDDRLPTFFITGLISFLLVGGFWLIKKIWKKFENLYLKLVLSFLVFIITGYLIFFLMVVLIVVFYLTY